MVNRILSPNYKLGVIASTLVFGVSLRDWVCRVSVGGMPGGGGGDGGVWGMREGKYLVDKLGI